MACVLEDLEFWGAWNTTCGHKAKDITPSTAWRREAWKEEVLDDWRWPSLVLSRKTLLEKTRKRHRQPDEAWKRFKGNVGEASERRDGAHRGFSERIYAILNWIKLNSKTNSRYFSSLNISKHKMKQAEHWTNRNRGQIKRLVAL